jgi:prepilin-type processing-associated H-X9-DG protein
MIETAPGWRSKEFERKQESPPWMQSHLDRIGQVLFLIRWLITKSAGEPDFVIGPNTLFTSSLPPNCVAKSNQTIFASSLHRGGVNAAMCDGSVRFIKNTVQSWPYDSNLGLPVGVTLNPGGWWENAP